MAKEIAWGDTMVRFWQNRSLTIFALALSSLVVQGCSFTYNTVGAFDNYAGVFEGKVSVSPGSTGTLSIHEIGGEITCSGTTWITYRPSGLIKQGARGEGLVNCSDGRIVEIKWVQSVEDGGNGKGVDQNGNSLHFRYDLDQVILANYKKAITKGATNKAELPPVYRPKETRKEQGFSTGTGFFISGDGHFITNFHVVDGAKKVSVTLQNDAVYDASIMASDPANDIVIGKISAKTTWIPLIDGKQLDKGEEVLALGYPLISIQGQQQKATFGRVNSVAGIQDDVRFYQVDVPIQPGNSGGPLLNKKGEVAGVITSTLNQITALRLTGSLPQNVNFAVKTDYLLPLIKSKIPKMLAGVMKTRSEMKTVDIIKQNEGAVFLIIAK